jgi:hypothetical protein
MPFIILFSFRTKLYQENPRIRQYASEQNGKDKPLMGYDRYGLDWSLRGAKSNAAASPGKTPADDTIARGWSEQPEKKQQDPEEIGRAHV